MITKFLRSKYFDAALLLLIIVYTILIFLYFAVAEVFLSQDDLLVFYIIELSILGIFCMEIGVNIIGFGRLYFRDTWNIFDIIIIILSVIFVFLDIFVNNSSLSSFLKIRSVFRILRIFILVRKLSSLKVRRDN
jgi:hypothetical protein